MMDLDLTSALSRRQFAAMRVLAAAVALRAHRKQGTPSASAYLAASTELNAATDAFVDVMEAQS